MNSYSVILAFTLIIYSTMLVGVLRDKRTKVRRVFSVYVVLAMCWSLNGLMLSLDVLGFPRLWASLMVISAICVVIAYYRFVSVFVNKTNDIPVKLGYAAVAFILVPLAVLGYLPESASISSNGMLHISYGKFLYLLTAIGAVFFCLSVVTLVRSYRASTDPLARNRIAYLLGGLGLLLAFSIRNSIPRWQLIR